MEIEVGRGFAASYMLPAAVDVVAERVGEAEVGEMGPDPFGRARGGDRLWQLGRQRMDELDRAGDGGDSFAQGTVAMLAGTAVELGRERPADPRLDGIDELLAAEADIMLDGLFWRRGVANVGQQLCEQLVPLVLALEQHAIEVEADGVEAQGFNPRTKSCRRGLRSRRA